ncbi:MAG: riboflavin kinase [Candidatus Latescibacteria bacterium]|nr:riboflavin kinase [Candidatus Latescibacterota bacterium]
MPELPLVFSGVVQTGQQRGRQLGFPTANIGVAGPAAASLPRGVFAARVRGAGTEDRWAVVNIGHRPTFDAGALSAEVHLLDFTGNLYGQVLEVELLVFLRGEKRFAEVGGLIAQVALDVEMTRNYIHNKVVNNAMEV